MGARKGVGVSLTVVLLALVIGGGALWWSQRSPSSQLQASSEQSGHDAAQADPGSGGDWRSDGETVGAWLQRSWDRSVEVRRVTLRADAESVRSGYLLFSDGSRVHVQLSGTTTVVPVTPRQVTSVRFTINDVDEGVTAVSVAEFTADDADGPAGAVATDARPDGDVAGEAELTGAPGGLVDDDAATTAEVSDEVLLEWDRPRELTSVSLAGAADGPTVGSAVLEFSDGSTLPVGAVTSDPERPTLVAFMPRVTTSLRLTAVGTSEDESPTLASLVVRQRGAAPVGPRGAGDAAKTDDGATPVGDVDCEPPGERPSDKTGLVVLCPTNGAAAGGVVSVEVAVGPSYSSVTASVWPAAQSARAKAATSATPDADGVAVLEVDTSMLPAGPFTVSLEATPGGGSGEATAAHLQLIRPGQVESASPDGPSGRTLVYDDEFDQPLSVNRSGDDADYVAGKPENWGVNDFGSAIFADPTLGYDNVTARDGYLRLAVSPRPPEVKDLNGWGREHLGGMLASARTGGSGVSAQFGYFEARMLAPANPGTWPAFWLLSNPGLVEDQPMVAEIDAVELYGHDPRLTCHTTHQYPDSEGVGEALCDQRWGSEQEAAQWHTYGVDVRPDRVVYFIDGERVADAPQVGAGDDPMFFMLDLALGGGWPIELASTRERADLYVDWVRVYV